MIHFLCNQHIAMSNCWNFQSGIPIVYLILFDLLYTACNLQTSYQNHVTFSTVSNATSLIYRKYHFWILLFYSSQPYKTSVLFWKHSTPIFFLLCMVYHQIFYKLGLTKRKLPLPAIHTSVSHFILKSMVLNVH